MRALVCGGRDFQDRQQLFRVLDVLHLWCPITLVIHGAYRGADLIAEEWAAERKIPDLPFPADWSALGRGAGPVRNRKMLNEGQPDRVVAFHGGDGTADMMAIARAAGVPVLHIPPRTLYPIDTRPRRAK